jgi:hypothetical protein
MLAIVEVTDVVREGGRKCDGGDEDQGMALSVRVEVGGGGGMLSLVIRLDGVLEGSGGSAEGAWKSRSRSSSSQKSSSVKKTAA